MIGWIRALTMTAVLIGFAGSAFAGGERVDDGSVSVFTNHGPMYVAKVTDKALLDEIARTGIELPVGTMVAVHNGKAYLVKDVRMPDGEMLSDKVLH